MACTSVTVGPTLDGTRNCATFVPDPRGGVIDATVSGFLVVFAILLASFPAHHLDLWQHLANGRDLLSGSGSLTRTWLYDLTTYGVYTVAGGVGLAAAKALLCGAAALLMFRASRVASDWRLVLGVLGLAVLAMGSRLLLQPATVSLFFLAGVVYLLAREREGVSPRADVWPGWRLPVLFLVWANTDGRFVIGLGVAALYWLGRAIDARGVGAFRTELVRAAGRVAILVAAACISPAHVTGFGPPPELLAAVESFRGGADADGASVNSPFSRDYPRLFGDRPAWLAYYPLLGLCLLAVVLNRRHCPWTWSLPLAGLVVLSGVQGRLIPFFAVVAGPVTVWNLRDVLARRGDAASGGRVRFAVASVSVLLAATFLVAAWPGWLQGPPFQPRRWVVETPVAHRSAAEYLTRARAANLWEPDSRTLHAGTDAAGAFAWFAASDPQIRDDESFARLFDPDRQESARQRLRELRVRRIVVDAGDRDGASPAALVRLLSDPYEWPVLHLTGGVVVFGWRDPDRPGDVGLYREWEVDFDRLAFRPEEAESAPGVGPDLSRHWRDAFRNPAGPQRPTGREEAVVLMRKAEVSVPAARIEHIFVWESSQAAGLAASAAAWASPAGALDAGVRVALLAPPDVTPGPLGEIGSAYRERFGFDRGDAPAGVLYAAVRAARRAVAENPRDAGSYLVLGRAYLALLTTTEERGWATQLPQLRRVRQMQASAAFNRAIVLNPELAAAHLELGQLYRSLNCLDFAVRHLRTFRELPGCFGGWGDLPPGDQRAKSFDAELDQLTKYVESQGREFAAESVNVAVSDRAQMAARRGLVGEALTLLMKSDVSAFGQRGADLELSLLLHSGRPGEVEAALTTDLVGLLGESSYHWLRAQAHCAAGDYDAADAELEQLSGIGGVPLPGLIGFEVSGLIGKTLLDQHPGGFSTAAVILGPLSRDALQSRVVEITDNLRRSADVDTLRGIVLLEAGSVARAREAFRSALVFAPQLTGGAGAGGQRVARDCLRLLGDPRGP